MPSVSANHIAGAGGGQSFEPQRECNFTVNITELSPDCELTVQNLTLPTFGVNKAQVPFQNETRNYAGKIQYGDVTISCFAVVGQGIGDKIWDWFQSVCDPKEGKVFKASAYKKDGDLVLHGPDGSDEKTWKLEGCFPINVNPGTGNMGGDGPMTIEVTLAVDKVLKG